MVTIARLLVEVGFEASFALAAPRGQGPLAIALAQVGRCVDHLRVVHTRPRRLLYQRHLSPRRCHREVSKVDSYLRAGYVVHLQEIMINQEIYLQALLSFLTNQGSCGTNHTQSSGTLAECLNLILVQQ